jgi:hypothetical protein
MGDCKFICDGGFPHLMEITEAIARQDLEQMLGKVTTIGAGSDTERSAQLVLQTLSVLRRRLSNKPIIKMLYIDNAEAKALIPGTAYNIAEQYVNGSLTETDASTQLEQAEAAYNKVFSQMGYTPSRSTALFLRQE